MTDDVDKQAVEDPREKAREELRKQAEQIDRYVSAQYPEWRKFPPRQVDSVQIADLLSLLTYIDMIRDDCDAMAARMEQQAAKMVSTLSYVDMVEGENKAMAERLERQAERMGKLRSVVEAVGECRRRTLFTTPLTNESLAVPEEFLASWRWVEKTYKEALGDGDVVQD